MSRTLAAAEVFALTFSFVWLVFGGPLAWALRDGLGPHAVTSHGWHAMTRFIHSLHYGGVASALAIATVVLHRLRAAAEQRAQEIA